MRLAAFAIALTLARAGSEPPAPVVWRLDNLSTLGADRVSVIGAPAIVDSEIGRVMRFDGRADGLLLERNPIEGLSRFTVEVLFAPDPDGAEEQRFLHIEELAAPNRALIELRLAAKRWSLDSYLRHGDARLTLLDRAVTHDTSGWHVAAMTFDGKTMAHYVDGVPQGSGPVAFRALSAGRTSIGVRQNRESWFKGRIHTVRVTADVLAPAAFLQVPLSIVLWPEGVPGLKADAGPEQTVDGRVTNVHYPSMTFYPVITMHSPYAHGGSVTSLLGPRPDPPLVDRLSIERQVRRDMPPVFVVHTSEDKTVPIENTLVLVDALRRAGVPVESHLYEKGAHGFGVAAGLGPTSQWPARLVEWLAARGFAAESRQSTAGDAWPRGIEGQRKADFGNGTFLNPIVAGDHPDPSVLKDGDDYYMTFSSFDAYPGLVIWHSRDLVNWQPIGPALFKNVGSVWAPDLVKHKGRYYIYFPGIGPYRSNYVIWADDIRGPWSQPIDLKLTRIDPGHAVGPDGRRYLFLSAGYLVTLTDDGLATVGEPRKIYDGWKYPDDWIVETFAQEGPKIVRRGDYYYMVLAEGGTSGPPTGHMIVAARSKTIEGPWENSPFNPIVRTRSAAERWWSKGHGTLVTDAAGEWWMVYHAYENGFYTLGRQTLLEPIEWTSDGWFRIAGSDPAKPIRKPAGASTPHGFAYSDDFSRSKMGIQWSFYNGDESDRERFRYQDGSLVLKAKGSGPADSSPLWFVNGDHAYEIEVEIDADAGAMAGLLLFYNRRLYAGLGFTAKNFLMHSYGLDRLQGKPAHLGQRMLLRLRNDRHILTMHYSVDGQKWERYDRAMELSGYHHNVGYDFLSLRPAIYAAGSGEVRFRNFKYRALP